MYRNTVYSDDKIVNLDEYKKSSIHQKRQQEQLYKKNKNNKKNKNKKYNSSKELKFNIITFVVILSLISILCLGLAYYFNNKNYSYKAEPIENGYLVKH